MPSESNLEYLWLFSNKFTSNNISMDYIAPNMIQLLLGNNILGGHVHLNNIPETMEFILLDYNNISKGVRFPNSIPDTCQIRLDVGVFCTQAICDTFVSANCSLSAFRSSDRCSGYIPCLETCQCALCGNPS